MNSTCRQCGLYTRCDRRLIACHEAYCTAIDSGDLESADAM